MHPFFSIAVYSILTATLCGLTVPCAQANTATGQAHAEIVRSIELSETQAMNFGKIALNGGAADIVKLNTNGSISSSSANLISGSTVQNAIFSTNGSPNSVVSVSFEDGFLTGAGSAISLKNFTHNAGATPTLSGAGILTFAVGADLHINENQDTGAYSGTYQVTVNYQ